ncbi:MAG: ATP-binding protein [Campylobacterota bacterium]|nr:ATP-binding protein [Campylobacterota bacterium]
MPNLNLKNFAKIKDSDFDIQDITVFAGKPGSGKSYIMKMLYALDETPSKVTSEIKYAKVQLSNITKKHGKTSEINTEELTKDEISEIKSLLRKIESLDTFMIKNDKVLLQSYKNILESIFGSIEQISSAFSVNHTDVKLDYSNKNLSVELIDNEDEIIDSVVFVETPLILEFKQFMNRREGKTPYHIESLLNILDKDYSFSDEEQDEFIKSFVEKSRKIIKGNIEDRGNSFIFKTDDNKNYDIINASSGIKSIGLLQYLVTNKALKKGSTLFWEEPEVHLHPTWQLKMIDLFIELMNAGVKIVFSTHSPFMADYLNAKATREKFGERISFNLLNEKEGVVSNTILNDENWNLLQDELMGAFEDIMWQYL